MNDDHEEEEENGGENCALVIEEIEREIERAEKTNVFFFASRSFCNSAFRIRSTKKDTTGKKEEEEGGGRQTTTRIRTEKKGTRARREAVEWRRKKIEEKTFDPRAAFERE